MTIGPDHHRQKYRTAARNWSVELQQTHTETGMTSVSHQQKLHTIDQKVDCRYNRSCYQWRQESSRPRSRPIHQPSRTPDSRHYCCYFFYGL